MMISENCIEYNDTRKICTAEQNGKKYVLENRSLLKIKKARIDGCMQQEEGQRLCDYLMRMDEGKVKRVIFIELKGRQYEEAANQIFSTINILKNEFKSYRIDARIVGNRIAPDYTNVTSYKNLKRVITPTKGTIKQSTNGFYSETV